MSLNRPDQLKYIFCNKACQKNDDEFKVTTGGAWCRLFSLFFAHFQQVKLIQMSEPIISTIKTKLTMLREQGEKKTVGNTWMHMNKEIFG